MLDAFNKLVIYFDMIRNTYVSISLIIRFSIVVILFGAIRFTFLKHEIESKKKKRFNEYDDSWILEHVCYETLISFMLCYTVVVLTGAKEEYIMVNYFIAPGVGAIFGMLVDTKVIIPHENNSKLEEGNREIHNEILITDEKTGFSYVHLDDKTGESPDFEDITVDAVNKLGEFNLSGKSSLSKLTSNIDELSKKLDIVYDCTTRNVIMNLQQDMYDCLNAGFATPKQDHIVTNEYKMFKLLNCKDEYIEDLYARRYLTLGVHEDRRKNRDSNYTGPEKRQERKEENFEFRDVKLDNKDDKKVEKSDE